MNLKSIHIREDLHKRLKLQAIEEKTTAKKLLEIIIKNTLDLDSLYEMALNRDVWIDKVRYQLEGALGEYAKLSYARELNIKDYWSDEINRLLKVVDKLMVKQKTKTKFKRDLAFAEAFEDAKYSQNQIVDAKKEMSKKFPKETSKKILKISFESEKLLKEMLKEFRPKLRKLI